MSDNKLSPVEAARMILEGAKEILKKNEDMLKAANTAHVIEDGAKPTEGAECPESLSSSEHSESSEMEDTPLQDHDEDEEKEEESDEEEYEFQKSESGMHTVEYKTLKKGNTFGTGGMSGSSTPGIKGFGSVISGGNPPPVNKSDKQIKIKHSKRGEEKTLSREASDATAIKPGTQSAKKQTDRVMEERDAKNKAREAHAKTGKINPKYGENEFSNTATDRRDPDAKGTIRNRKKDRDSRKKSPTGDSERSMPRKRSTDPKNKGKQAQTGHIKPLKSSEMEKCGEMKRSEGADHNAKEIDGIDWDKKGKKDMDKCGDMVSSKKLKKFMKKSSEDSCKKSKE